jgi:hypothetical protein
MKCLILAALLFMPVLCLASDNDSYRHEDSDYAGDSARHHHQTIYHDEYGNYAGSETRYNDGQTIIRDKDGEIIGIINKDSD